MSRVEVKGLQRGGIVLLGGEQLELDQHLSNELPSGEATLLAGEWLESDEHLSNELPSGDNTVGGRVA